MSILHNRVRAIAGVVRLQCPETMIDERKLESLRLPRGGVPLSVTGSLVFNQAGIEARGRVGARSAAGTITPASALRLLGAKWHATRHRSDTTSRGWHGSVAAWKAWGEKRYMTA